MTNSNILQKNWLPGLAALLFVILAAPVLAQDPGTRRGGRGMDDPDRVVEGGGVFPNGWSARVDMGRGGQPQSPNLVIFKEEGQGFRAILGPAATFYNSSWTKSGNYSFSARVVQDEKPSHPISYGIFVGGSDVGGDNQSYTYFLVHADREGAGQFFIANRKGAEVTKVVDWTTSASVNKPDDMGRQTNVLGIQVQGNNVIFTSNGTEVARKTKSEVTAEGVIGFRVTHNTNVVIDQIKR